MAISPSNVAKSFGGIIIIEARSATSALTKAKRMENRAEFNYENDEGNTVYFEFIGVMDLLCLGVECDTDEVWYDIRDRISPMERRNQFIPPESQLNAIRTETEGRATRHGRKAESPSA